MLTIRNEKFLKFSDNDSTAAPKVIVEIDVDTASELPEINGIIGITLHRGSTAFIVKEGRIAVLAGDGKWYDNGNAIS